MPTLIRTTPKAQCQGRKHEHRAMQRVQRKRSNGNQSLRASKKICTQKPQLITTIQTRCARGIANLAILSPLVFAANLLLLLWGEIVGDVEGLADLLGGLALDHVGNGLATNIEERLDIEVVGSLKQILASRHCKPVYLIRSIWRLHLLYNWRTYEDDLEQHLLVDLHELLVPLIDIGGLLARVGIVICGSCGLSFVMLAPLDNLAEDGLVDLQKGVC